MIYAVIIIIALALAFIILIRRLPEAMSFSGGTSERKPLRLRWPRISIRLPKVRIPKLPERKPRESQPTLTDSPVGSETNRSPFPFFSKVKTSPSEEEGVPQAVEKPEDFWEADSKEEVTTETLVPTPEVIKERPQPVKAKDLGIEAEQAFSTKDYRKAEKFYLRLATTDPKNAKIYSRLGIIYLEQKNYEDARDAFQQAIKLEPHVATRHFNLALSYMNLGSRAKAITAMEAALKYEPSNRKYRKTLDDILAGRT